MTSKVRWVTGVIGVLWFVTTASPAVSRPYMTEQFEGEGKALEYVEVPAEMGDGIISERDARSLAEFTTWLYDRLLQTADPSAELSPESDDRAMEFWTYVWDVVDVDTRALVSQMDVIWPQARANWSGANAAQREQIATDILQLIISVWGDEAVATASYLAGEITYDEYLPFMNVVHSRWAAGAEAGGNDVQGTAEGGAAEGGSTDDGPSIHDMISTHLGSFIVYQ